MRKLVLIIGAALVFIGALSWMPMGAKRERVRRVKCLRQIKSLGVALHVYASDNNGRFPDSLGRLFPGYVQDGSVFHCPSARGSETIGIDDLQPGKPDASGLLSDRYTDYIYVRGSLPTHPASSVLMYEKQTNHGDGSCVLDVGGHGVWMTQEQLQEALKVTRAALEKKSHPAQ